MPVDVEKLVASHIKRRTNGCMTCHWVSTRDEKEQAGWDRVMASSVGEYPHAAVFRAIHEVDPSSRVGKGSIEGHRANKHRVVP